MVHGVMFEQKKFFMVSFQFAYTMTHYQVYEMIACTQIKILDIYVLQRGLDYVLFF